MMGRAMNHDYSFLGITSLDSGSWADWFSGTMTAIAVVIALAGPWIAQRQREADQRKAELEIGRLIGWRIWKLLNATRDIQIHIRESLKDPKATMPPGMKFPLVRALGVPGDGPRDIPQSEINLLLNGKAADLLAEIETTTGRYRSILWALNEYKIRQEAFFELMPDPVAVNGTVFTHALTAEQIATVMPHANMLEALLDNIIELVDENVDRIEAALPMYYEEMKKMFGSPLITFTKKST